MFKLLLLGGIIYFVYQYMWRDNSLTIKSKSTPFVQKPTKDKQEIIEDAEFTEEKE
jgi:hypothetical protein